LSGGESHHSERVKEGVAVQNMGTELEEDQLRKTLQKKE
jgi:hypothetical protein